MPRPIHYYHDLGKQVSKGLDKGRAIKDLVEELGESEFTLTKSRVFAERYTPRDLERLHNLRQPNGQPLRWGHVVQLISVPSKRDRRQLEKRIAEEGTSIPELRIVVQDLIGHKRKSGGRPLYQPDDAGESLKNLATETELWVRRCRQVWAAPKAGIANQIEGLSANKRKNLKKPLDTAIEQLEAMQRNLKVLLKQFRQVG